MQNLLADASGSSRISTLDEASDLLDSWVDLRRRIAALEAESADLLARRSEVCDRDIKDYPVHREMIRRSMVAEYAAAGHLSRGSIAHSFADAEIVAEFFPRIRGAYRAGLITAQHVRELVGASDVIREAVRNGRIGDEVVAAFEEAALAVAEADSPARTRVAARQIAAVLAEESVIERQERARDERTVMVRSVEDGLALITVVLPEHLAVAIRDRLTRMARTIVRARATTDAEPGISLDTTAETVAAPGTASDPVLDDDVDGEDASTPDVHDVRTMDQIRADLLADLLLTADPGDCHGTALDGITGHIQVTVAATTLAGADDRLAELDGHGALHPEVARDLASRSGGWTRLFLDAKGLIVETDAYSPTEAMRRFLRARDRHCRFPGCRMPARDSQIDHNHDHAKGGKTRIDNLACFCTGHHALKHPDIDDRFRWSARSLPDGSLMWNSPLGRDYADPPPRRVMFV